MFNFNDPQALYNFMINSVAEYGTYEEFVKFLYPQIDEIVSDMISSSEDFVNASEDYISNRICSSLIDRKFNAVRAPIGIAAASSYVILIGFIDTGPSSGRHLYSA